MKKILALTDFSANATCAAEAALRLAGKLHTDLLLFNTYIDYATMPTYGGAGWIVNEVARKKKSSTQGLQLLLEGLESLSFSLLDAYDRKPEISFDANDCDLETEVIDLLTQNAVELIVMGARSHHRAEPLYGADTNAVINHARCPVLVVPANTNLKQIQNVVFATDFDEADFKAIHYIVKLCKHFNYQLAIIHVIKPGQYDAHLAEQELLLKERLAEIRYDGLTFKQVGGLDVIDQLNQLCTENGQALLALLHHQRSFFGAMFARSETRRALKEQQVPLLIFPSKMSVI